MITATIPLCPPVPHDLEAAIDLLRASVLNGFAVTIEFKP